ncbi:MAG TPA: carboxymuconolactone decarboxylase family protein [Candidatus Thermoplasmatota archaeon]|nr:carboxymuconolactone decarboxylase family protein [Candidatus Thermoplasmatota archaeon]
MEEYEETLKDIQNTIGVVPGFMKALPKEVLTHDWVLWKKYTLGTTKIPAKYRELAGLEIAANIKCPYCELMHTAMAKFYGATDEELAEVYYLASLTARWSAMLHAQHYDWGTFEKEAQQMGKYLEKNWEEEVEM